MIAGNFLSRISMSICPLIFACEAETYAIPTPQFKLGERVPLVTSPIRSPLRSGKGVCPWIESRVGDGRACGLAGEQLIDRQRTGGKAIGGRNGHQPQEKCQNGHASHSRDYGAVAPWWTRKTMAAAMTATITARPSAECSMSSSGGTCVCGLRPWIIAGTSGLFLMKV